MGSVGVVGGQQDDLDAEGGRGQAGDDPAALLDRIHRRKTAALIRVSCQLGAICGGAAKLEEETLADFGEHVGLAFQIIDDLLDTTADAATLGKTPGKDANVGKLTWPSVHGIEAAQKAANEHTAAAEAALENPSAPKPTACAKWRRSCYSGATRPCAASVHALAAARSRVWP